MNLIFRVSEFHLFPKRMSAVDLSTVSVMGHLNLGLNLYVLSGFTSVLLIKTKKAMLNIGNLSLVARMPSLSPICCVRFEYDEIEDFVVLTGLSQISNQTLPITVVLQLDGVNG